MNIIIRVDASVEIGTGHVMRCLTIAEYLKERGAAISFVCNDLEGHMCEYIKKKDFNVFMIQIRHEQASEDTYNWKEDAKQTIEIVSKIRNVDWFIVDHYLLDINYESVIRQYVNKIMVIDDLANRQHTCDILLDQNYFNNSNERYKHLVSDHSIKLLGPKYVLLRKQFLDLRKKLKPHNGIVKRIFVFFGGCDPTNETEKVIKALASLQNRNLIIDVVVGKANKNGEVIRSLCANSAQFNYYCQIENIAELMSKADLAIGACGTTAWERIYLGIPTITIEVAKNQTDVAKQLDQLNVIINLGWHSNVTVESLKEIIMNTIQDKIKLQQLSNKAKKLMQYTHTNHVVYMIMKNSHFEYKGYRVRPIEKKDLDIVLKMRNSPNIRHNMYNSSIISMEEHLKWYENLHYSKAVYLIFEKDTEAIGVIYFNHVDETNNRCNWGFYINDAYVGKGLGAKMGYLGLEYAFTKLGFYKICGETFSYNKESIKFHQKLKFTKEGYFHSHVFKEGKYEDIVFFSLLKDVWEQNKKLIEERIF